MKNILIYSIFILAEKLNFVKISDGISMENTVEKIDFKTRIKKNPAWYGLLFTLFTFFLLPEYVSPFILFAAFIVFKRQWKKEGRLAKVGNIGKLEMAFMCLMLVSTLWSPTKLDTLGSAGLWWAVILVQVMIYNLARTKERIDKVISVIVASAAVNGIVGGIQLTTFVLNANKYTPAWTVLPTPFYRYIDTAVYTAMPFKIGTFMWANRASGFFSNPNLLASFMLVAFPLGIYLLFNSETKKEKIRRFTALTFISFGMASTQTRAGCYVMLGAWAVIFVLFIRRRALQMLALFIPTGGSTIFALLVRYGKINIYPNVTFLPVSPEEALLSSARHLEIWGDLIDHITHHISVFIIGMGFGCEQTGNILINNYNLKKPHAHNFVIEMWAELGVIGVVFLLFIIVYALGKLLEVKPVDFKVLSLKLTAFASFISLLIFGLSDYIFNSPKQIILFMICIGLIQAISYTYDKKEIDSLKDIPKITTNELQNIIKQ